MAANVIFVEIFLNLLESYEHNDIPTAKSEEVCLETLVETKWTIVFQNVTNNSKEATWLSLTCIHHSSFEYIDRGTAKYSAKTCTKSAKSVSSQRGWLHADFLDCNLFELIVSS